MPKDLSRAAMSSKSRGLYKPYATGHARNGVAEESSSVEKEEVALAKEWEDATCPICMECPHNAVLLVCTSHDKGCRPYMCDTSYRHSNCLDQYRKASSVADKNVSGTASVSDESAAEPGWHGVLAASELSRERNEHWRAHERFSRRVAAGASASESRTDALGEDRGVLERSGQLRVPLLAPDLLRDAEDGESHRHRWEELEIPRGDAFQGRVAMDLLDRGVSGDSGEMDLKCPLCRGKVNGWKVVDLARRHLNHKKRSCSQESCTFIGTYEELRKHARGVHPLARPSDVDPVRQRDWRRLERQRDLADVLSTFRSAMPGATVIGDFLIGEEEEEHEEMGEELDFPADGENWWTMILLFQVFGPAAAMGGGRGMGRLRGGLSRGHHRMHHHHHQSGNGLSRQALWGENLQGSGSGVNSLPSGNGGSGDIINLGSASRRRRTRPRSRGDLQ